MEIFHGGLPVILPFSVLQQILQADRLEGGAGEVNPNTRPPLPAPRSSSALRGTCV